MKQLLILVLMISLNSFSQDRLMPNTHPNSPEHSMVLENDTIKISSEHPVIRFHMYGLDYDKQITNPIFQGNSMNIDVSKVPNGYYTFYVSVKGVSVMANFIKSPLDPQPVEEPKSKKVIIHVPYNNTTTRVRKDTRESDTVYIRESRDEFKARTGAGKRIESRFPEE